MGQDEVKPTTGSDLPQLVAAFPESMPEKWVQQIANVRPSFWPAFLGSAVLAALIGWASSYFTARMTISANVQLETVKADLQRSQDQARTRSQAYASLASSLNDLHNAFASYIILVELASEHGMDRGDMAALDSQSLEVGKAEAKVQAARTNANLISDPISADVNLCLGDLNTAIFQAKSDRKSILKHQDIDAKMVSLTTRAQQSATLPTQSSH